MCFRFLNLLLWLPAVLLSCDESKTVTTKQVIQIIYSGDTLPLQLENLAVTRTTPEHTYAATKTHIRHKLTALQRTGASDDTLSAVFQRLLLDEVIPYWYGTPWSFEGHTEVPGQGEIACGYFVSTTLRDMGLLVNRYKLAQQLPIHEAQSLQCGSELLTFERSSTDSIIHDMRRSLPDGLYFVGLDAQHVGFLLRRGNTLTMIHSLFINQRGVEAESVDTSAVFAMFRKLYVVPISGNKNLMRAWLMGSEIKVVTE